MDNFEFYAIQSTIDCFEGDWSVEFVSSSPNYLVDSFRTLRLIHPNLYYRVVRISLKTEVIVSHNYEFPRQNS